MARKTVRIVDGHIRMNPQQTSSWRWGPRFGGGAWAIGPSLGDAPWAVRAVFDSSVPVDDEARFDKMLENIVWEAEHPEDVRALVRAQPDTRPRLLPRMPIEVSPETDPRTWERYRTVLPIGLEDAMVELNEIARQQLAHPDA